MSKDQEPGGYSSDSDECDDDEQRDQRSDPHESTIAVDEESNSSRNEDKSSTSDTELEQSFVGKISHNVSSFLSKLIRNAKDKLGIASPQRSTEHDGTEIQPPKRRRLYEAEDGRVRSGRIDQACQTQQSYLHTAEMYSRENTPFAPTHDSIQCDERADGTEEEEEHPVQDGNAQQIKDREQLDLLEEFDPFKYLAENDKTPVDPKRRITTFMGNRCYRKRQEKLRRGMIGRLFYASHQKPNKNLDTSERPSFGWGAYRANSNKRIPPEYGGSPFYNGFTRYGGASAANTLGTHFTVTRSPLKSVLLRNPTELPMRGQKRGLEQDSPPPARMSFTTQRMLDILEEFDASKKLGKPDVIPNESISQELQEMSNRSLLPSCSSRVSQMLQMLRQQKLAGMLCERDTKGPYPPTAPLIDVMPLNVYYFNDTTENQETAEPAGNQTATTGARTHENDTVVERNVADEAAERRTTISVQRAVNDDAPTSSNVTEQSASATDNTAQADPLPTNEEEQDSEQMLEKTANDNSLQTTVNSFTFSDPIELDDDKQGSEMPIANLPAFTFAEVERLNNADQPPVRSFLDLMAESANKWVCDICMVRNEPHQRACVACGNCAPTTSKSNVPSLSSAPFAPSEHGGENPTATRKNKHSSFKSLVKRHKVSSAWVCDTCMATNSVEMSRCLCCDLVNPNCSSTGPTMPTFYPESIPAIQQSASSISNTSSMSDINATESITPQPSDDIHEVPSQPAQFGGKSNNSFIVGSWESLENAFMSNPNGIREYPPSSISSDSTRQSKQALLFSGVSQPIPSVQFHPAYETKKMVRRLKLKAGSAKRLITRMEHR